MMSKLIRLTIGLTIVLFGAISMLILLGSLQAKFQILPELDRCDQDICLFNSRLKTTSYSQFMANLINSRQFEVRTNRTSGTYHAAYRNAPPVYVLALHTNRHDPNDINTIDLLFSETQTEITAGAAIAQLGRPCVTSSPGNMVLMYPSASLIFRTENQTVPQRLDMALPLYQIIIYKNSKTCADWLKKYPAGKWRGFTSYCRYNEIQSQYLAQYQNLPYDC